MAILAVQDQVIHHAANAAAVTIPFMSIWLHAPMFFTILTAALGSAWYAILIGEKIYQWCTRGQSDKQG